MPLIRKPTSIAVEHPASARPSLASGTSEERWAAARAAGASVENTASLKAALSEEKDPRVREAIFTSLALINTDESAAVLFHHLRSDDARMRTGALDALRTMPERIVSHLPDLLADPDSDVRVLACDLCRGVPTAALQGMLGHLLAHEVEANVCAAAVDVLADCGGEEVLPGLAQCAERFGADPFLGFSIKIAIDRIASQKSSRRE